MFGDQHLAVSRAWEDRFFSGELTTRGATFLDDDDEEAGSDACGSYQRVGGVAVIDIDGPLMQHGGWYFDGHESTRAKFETAAKDPRVSLVAMRVDSPGGVVAGCFDNVRGAIEVLSAAGKPCVAWAGGNGAYSAGYAWACVASEISVPDTGGVGSVGVLSTMMDRTKMTADAGLRIEVIRSGQRKAEGHPDVPTTDGAIAREQAVVDGMADVFASVVGGSRGMKPADVLGFEGESFYGAKAVEAGYADRVESFDAFLARCVARAEEMQMKSTATRLGLAETATEADIIKAIDSLEQAKVKAEVGEKKATADLDKLGGEFLESVCEEALVSGRKTKAQIDSDRELFAELPKARAASRAREAYSKLERGAALPKPSQESSVAPIVEGPSVTAAKAGDGAKRDGAKMSITEISAYYGGEHFDRLMAEHAKAQSSRDRAMFTQVSTGEAPRLGA